MKFRPVFLAVPLLLAGCGGGNDTASKPAIGALDSTARKQEAGATLGVNVYLWRGALETLGFMPITSADPYGGVIVTDWYSPPATPSERFKATAYVLGRELRADGIRVVIFRQTRDAGAWADAPVAPSTAAEIENRILARARELRAQTAPK